MKILEFIKNNFWTILKIIFGLFLFYWIIFFLTPKITLSEIEKSKLDSLNNNITELYKAQLVLDSNISVFNQQIDKVDEDISVVKNEKTIIREIYHEKINNVSNYNDGELDSFFAKRYGYNPR